MDSNTDYVARAMGIATMVHAGQVDKLGKPYLHHVLRVYLECVHGSVHGQCAALLHDVLEDSKGMVNRLDLVALFGRELADTVELLTLQKGDSYLKDYIPRIAAAGEWGVARRVKLADLSDNLGRMAALELDNPMMARRLRSRYLKALELLS